MSFWLKYRFELDGKDVESLRPGIVFKKLSHNTLLVITLTTQIYDLKGNLKNGSWYSTSFIYGSEGGYA
jgi:hypothetical protein